MWQPYCRTFVVFDKVMTEKKERRFVSILFADIEGYTAMMQLDELDASRRLQKFREVLIRKAEEFAGRIVNFYGDGCLVVFDQPTQALSCAYHIQRAYIHDVIVPVRIGLHCGEVVFEEELAYGDSINITSRIESMGVPGSVLFSKRFKEELGNKIPMETISLGRIHFKNVVHPVKVFALAGDGFAVPDKDHLLGKLRDATHHTATTSAKLINSWPMLSGIFAILIMLAFAIGQFYGKPTRPEVLERSIAVLPFDNLNDDTEQVYFSDGISQDILTRLSGIKDLNVISFNSSKTYRRTNKSPRQIAAELGTKHLLMGSVQKIGEQLRIRAVLVNAEEDKQLWAENYDRKIEDIFTIQSEVSSNIADMLKVELLPEVAVRLNQKPTHNLEAYQLYSEGRYHWGRRRPEDLNKAIELFNEAVELDAEFALGYSGLAQTYITIASNAYVAPDSAYPLSKFYAEKALWMDPTLAEAYATLAQYHALYDIDFQLSKAMHLKSVELKPGDATIHQWFAEDLCWMGEIDLARREIQIARRLDPASMTAKLVDRVILLAEGQVAASIDQLEALLAEHPDFETIIPNLAIGYLRLGKLKKVESLANSITILPGWREIILSLLYSETKQLNKLTQLRSEVDRMENDLLRQQLSYLVEKDINFARGNIKEFVAMTDSAVFEYRYIHPSILQTFPLPDNIWKRPEWQEVMKKRDFMSYPRSGRIPLEG